MCQLQDDCDHLHEMLHQCIQSLDKQDLKDADMLYTKLLASVNECEQVCDAAKLVAIFGLVVRGMRTLDEPQQVQ